jgi:DNA-binding MarR family transcriptional regulator/GNAT superfamily N-acetyltransferase
MRHDSGHVGAIRRFNRWYTRRIGVLDRGWAGSDFSLAETRVLYEICHRPAPPLASELAEDLGLDPGYLSRMLRAFAQRGLVKRVTSPEDARRGPLSLTAKGRKVFGAIDRKTSKDVGALVEHLPAGRRRSVIDAMRTIESSLGQPSNSRSFAALRMTENEPFTIRTHRAGDMGWIIHRHGILYVQEYGWDNTFEALVARICADFIDNFDPKAERCWLAERDGEILGSIFCVKKSKRVAKLRLLLVEPSARGLGVGTRLVDECVRFARAAGYTTLTLWTQNNLHAARRIYQRAGFQLASEESHHSFGKRLVAQNWDLALREPE